MLPQTRNPSAGDAGAAGNIKAGQAIDKRQNTFSSPESKVIAAAIIAERYCLTPPIARLVCHLSGLGGSQ